MQAAEKGERPSSYNLPAEGPLCPITIRARYRQSSGQATASRGGARTHPRRMNDGLSSSSGSWVIVWLLVLAIVGWECA